MSPAAVLRLRHAEAPPPPATAGLPRGRWRSGNLRVGPGYCSASAQSLAAASLRAPLFRSSVAVPLPRAPPSHSRRGAEGGGLLFLATVAASAVTISACFVFFSAIRSMLACKRAAESLEKSFNSAREKLPETTASVRLVGKEICDLAMDLSNLSQQLRKGVQGSMGVVHTADAQLHQLTNPVPQGTVQRVANLKRSEEEPLLASTVRELRELIAELQSVFGVAVSIGSLFLWASNFVSKRPKNRS